MKDDFDAGDHVLLRLVESEGFKEHGVVLSERVKVSSSLAETVDNKNKLVALSHGQPFTNMQVRTGMVYSHLCICHPTSLRQS